MIEDRSYETLNLKKSEKEHKNESKEDAAGDTADEMLKEDTPVPLVTQANNI